jgi:hypothetical protein
MHMSQVQTFFWLKVGGICKKKNIAFSNLLSLIVKNWGLQGLHLYWVMCLMVEDGYTAFADNDG